MQYKPKFQLQNNLNKFNKLCRHLLLILLQLSKFKLPLKFNPLNKHKFNNKQFKCSKHRHSKISKLKFSNRLKLNNFNNNNLKWSNRLSNHYHKLFKYYQLKIRLLYLLHNLLQSKMLQFHPRKQCMSNVLLVQLVNNAYLSHNWLSYQNLEVKTSSFNLIQIARIIFR